MIKLEHMAHMRETKNAQTVLVRTPKENKAFGRHSIHRRIILQCTSQKWMKGCGLH
jgi:hypothetical protein